MNKTLSTAAALMLTAAAFTACGSASKTRTSTASDSVSTTAASEASASQTVAGTEPSVQLQTVRERDIVSTDDLYDYEIYQGGAIITKYKGNEADVVVPDEIGGAPVTNIGFYCFEAKYDLKTVVLPDTVTVISEFAFSDCGSLNSINIPDGVTEIQRGAFAACGCLKTMTLPESVAAVREEAFTGCTELESLYAPNPDLDYENWGLEGSNVIVYSPSNSKLAQKAQTGVTYTWLPMYD